MNINKGLRNTLYLILTCIIVVGCVENAKKYEYGLTHKDVKNENVIYQQREIAFLMSKKMWHIASGYVSKNDSLYSVYNDSSDYYLAKEEYLRTLENNK